MSPEAALLAGLASDPCVEGWLVLADYWDETGDRRGELARLLHDPARIASLTDDDRGDRVLALCNAGVGPVCATVTDAIGIEYVWIPPGTFRMGGNGQKGNPKRRVAITRGFFMGVYPVTQRQYREVTGESPSHFAGDDRPVESVSWDDAVNFCERLAARTGRAIRLPTEAEWEYACRAGTTTEFWNGNGEANLKKIGWFGGNSGSQTHVVGEKRSPNPWGLHDIHGNVWEWCQDIYTDILSKDSQIDPVVTSGSIGARVLRGGSWSYDPTDCLAAYRSGYAPAHRVTYGGFRVCFRLD